MLLAVESMRALAGCAPGLHQRALVVRLIVELPGPVAGLGDAIRAGLRHVGIEPAAHAFAAAAADGGTVAAFFAQMCCEALVSLGHDAAPGEVLSADAGQRWAVSIPFDDEASARAAVQACELLLRSLIGACLGAPTAATPGELASIGRCRNLIRRHAPSFVGRELIRTSRRHDIPVTQFSGTHFLAGHGHRAWRLHVAGNFIPDSSTISCAALSANKPHTIALLARAGIPVPRQGGVARRVEECVEIAERLGYPVVTKPTNGSLSKGVRTGLRNADEVRKGFRDARRSGKEVMVERHVEGRMHRLLVVEGTLFAAYGLKFIGVTGDGHSTIHALVLRENERRAAEGRLKPIRWESEVDDRLAADGRSRDTVLADGEFVQLRGPTCIAKGGIPIDLQGRIHPDNRRVAERAVRVLGLRHGGVDFITPDIGRSCFEVGGVVNEVNCRPSLEGHRLLDPFRNPEVGILRRMGLLDRRRVPIVAIAGVTPSPHAADFAEAVFGHESGVGVSTGAGNRVGSCVVSPGRGSSVLDGHAILTEPDVTAAVVTLDLDHVASDGVPFDACDVLVLLPDCGEPLDAGRHAAAADLVARARRGVILDPVDGMLEPRRRLAAGKAVALAGCDGERAAALASMLRGAAG